MPELPEIETIRRQLEPRLVGRTILEADSHPSAKFTPARDLIDTRIVDARRRGKFLLFATDDNRDLIVHLGMTGALLFIDGHHGDADPALDDPYVRAWWQLDDAEGDPSRLLIFRDVRRFGRIRVVPAGDYRGIPTLVAMGPEPFDPTFDAKQFAALLAKSRRRLKTQLLSQRPIAGVGNIYADEALWLAKINPTVTRLGLARAESLLDAIRQVLAKSLDNGGTTLKDYRNVDGGEGENQRSLAAYGRAGLPCLRCETELSSAVIDARTTTWCATCQRR